VYPVHLHDVSVPEALFVKARINSLEQIEPVVDCGTLFSLCAGGHAGHEVIVERVAFIDNGQEFLLVVEENLPPRFERRMTMDRRARVQDAVSIHEFRRMEW